MKSKVIYDWVSFTSKIHSPEGIIDLLGLQGVAWEQIKGARGYKDRYYYNCISIHFNGSEEMGVWCEMSGQGCRVFESLGTGDYDYLFAEILYNADEMHLTRLDVAFDDRDGILDMDTMIIDTRMKNYVSKMSSWQITESNKGQSIVIGSPKSDMLIRIYDKAAERGYEDGTHWVRVEMQLRDQRAQEFVKHLVTPEGEHLSYNLGELYAAVLHNYLRFVCPSKVDLNKWRWPLMDYWAELLNGAARISIYSKPGTEYNLARCDNYVFNQAGNAVAALIDIYGVDSFLKKLRARPTRRNIKYDMLRDQYGLHGGNDAKETDHSSDFDTGNSGYAVDLDA